MAPGTEIVAATDTDEAGEAFARRIEAIVADLDGYGFRHSPPADGDDWNDVLRRDSVLPAARFLQPFPTGPEHR